MEFESIAQQVQKQREEIAMADANMFHGVYVIAVLVVAAYIAATVSGKLELHKLVLMLVVGLPFFIARQDYMIHRLGGYIRYTEVKSLGELSGSGLEHERASPIESWETWKQNRKSRLTVLPILDLLGPVALLYVVWCSALAVYQLNPTFTISAGAGVILGICAIPLAVMFAGK